MKFASVLFLAAWQLTAVPFVSLLVAQGQRPSVAAADNGAGNVTIVYKTPDTDGAVSRGGSRIESGGMPN